MVVSRKRRVREREKKASSVSVGVGVKSSFLHSAGRWGLLLLFIVFFFGCSF
jgi:hypothetical protein